MNYLLDDFILYIKEELNNLNFIEVKDNTDLVTIKENFYDLNIKENDEIISNHNSFLYKNNKCFLTHGTPKLIKYINTEYNFSNNNKPIVFYIINKVFRNENRDKTHLNSFHQIDFLSINMNKNEYLNHIYLFLKKIKLLKEDSNITLNKTYYPFTYDSFEIYIDNLEILGGGIFKDNIIHNKLLEKKILFGTGIGIERLLLLLNKNIQLHGLFDIESS